MARKKKGASWRTSLSFWTQGFGAQNRPTYAHEEYGQLYELQPYPVAGKIFYVTTVSSGKQTDRVLYVTEDGATSASAVLHKDARAALQAAGTHNTTLRSKKHAHPLAPAFRSRFQRV